MRYLPLGAGLVIAMLLLSACEHQPTKEEEEAAKNTFACTLRGERLVIRFASGEARMLMPDSERVVLYQIPTTSGVRFANGTFELRGKGTDLSLSENNSNPTALVGCEQYTPPAGTK